MESKAYLGAKQTKVCTPFSEQYPPVMADQLLQTLKSGAGQGFVAAAQQRLCFIPAGQSNR
jgi:hypothetical protein